MPAPSLRERPPTPEPAPRRVLVADKNAARAEGMARFLRRRGLSTTTSSDAGSAKSAVRGSLVHLVVAAAEFGPARLLAAARERAPEAECLVLASESSLGESASALREGAYDVMESPLDLGRLGLAVDRALERGAMRAELDRLRRALGKSG